ncbi:MAG TPA: response regulator [Gemmatimonadales bacterium]
MRTAGRELTVLVVDDEHAICRALSMAFGHAGCHALTAESGEAALALLAQQHVDALVLDLRIPDMRGDALLHLAAAMQPHLRHQTLFVTGDWDPRALALIGACGAPLVRKPFQLVDVIESVFALVPGEGEGVGRRA